MSEPLLHPVGTRVRAIYPNPKWGEGVVTDADATVKVRNEATGRMIRRKPYVVTREDGAVGYFHPDQIEVIQ